MSCVLVIRNECWFEYAATALKEVWETIEKERVSGYEHRAPNKRKPKGISSYNQSGLSLNNSLFNVIKIDTEPQNQTNTIVEEDLEVEQHAKVEQNAKVEQKQKNHKRDLLVKY